MESLQLWLKGIGQNYSLQELENLQKFSLSNKKFARDTPRDWSTNQFTRKRLHDQNEDRQRLTFIQIQM